MQKIWIIVLFVINGFITSAQNNPIFQGGAGDGINKISFAQAGNNIFSGGNGDGWNATSFIQTAVNIFSGGIGDGWNQTSFVQAGNAIFKGGDGDGWNKTSFLQPGNSIFNGGDGDGWNSTTFLQAGNNIFNGGIGDGWSSTYRPMGPLPVTFMFFTAGKKDESAALLNWRTSQELNSAYFDVERSTNAMIYSKIGTVTAAGNSSSPVNYYFTDYKPESGLNYYRLKQVDSDGHFIYTVSRVVKFNNLDGGNVKFYPNPTKGTLNIELTKEMTAQVKLVNISNAAGIVINQLRLGNVSTRIIQVDLSQYPKGTYFIQLSTGTANSTHRVILQ